VQGRQRGVPTLHVYLREAEPCDVFDAVGLCTLNQVDP
jgi:hypothetical protein